MLWLIPVLDVVIPRTWQESHFPIFFQRNFSLFLVEISIWVDPLKFCFSCFLKVKSEKKKKKKKDPQLFSVLFPLHFSFSIFPCSFFPSVFLIFLLPFSIFHNFLLLFPFFQLFLLPHFSWFIAKNFLVESLGGRLPPCPPPPTCYATGWSWEAHLDANLCKV